MKKLLVLLLLAAGCGSPAARLAESVRTLSTGPMTGRQTGTEAERLAADWIEARFREAGLDCDNGAYRRPFTFKRARAHGEEPVDIGGINVVGYVKRDPASTVGDLSGLEVLVVGAHYDHLGPEHPGADDNASGTAILIELARRFACRPAGRPVVFCAFSGEEEGIVGSKAYAEAPIGAAVAMINMDMVGRLRDGKLIVLGADTSPEWEAILKEENRGGLSLSLAKGGIGPSDHTAFYRKGVPVLHFFTGAHADYHNPGDTVDKVNATGMARIADLVEGVVRRVADRPGRLEFRTSDADFVPRDTPAPGARPYLGAMPDYTDTTIMRVDSVAEGSPAAEAGLKSGDRIVEWDGEAVTSLDSYSARFFGSKPGQRVVLTVKRGDELLEIQVVLGARSK